MKKNITIIILIIVTISIVINLYSISFSDNKSIIEKVSTKETFTDKENMLSIMIHEESGVYTEYLDRTKWPDFQNYKYERAECTDSEGTIIPSEEAVTFENNTIHIKTKNTIYCTLYFNENRVEKLIKKLKNDDKNNSLSETIMGDMYRYQGIINDTGKSNVTNWICFGTENQSKCKEQYDKYLYRIIGITPDGKIKLIKEVEIEENNIKAFVWNDKYYVKDDGSHSQDVCDNGLIVYFLKG